MNPAACALTACVLLVCILLLARPAPAPAFSVSRQVSVRRGADSFSVHADHADRAGAARTLAGVAGRLTASIAALPPSALRRRLRARFDPAGLVETSPNDPRDDVTSYTVDKARVALCLRERDPRGIGDPRVQDLHDLNTLTFVALHELAHVGTVSHGHTPEFWRNFATLRAGAARAGAYAPHDFAASPRRYCGMTLDSNPPARTN
jgi:hypothetical protein